MRSKVFSNRRGTQINADELHLRLFVLIGGSRVISRIEWGDRPSLSENQHPVSGLVAQDSVLSDK